MNSLDKKIPWIVLLLTLVVVGYMATKRTRLHNEFDMHAFGELPVQKGGRVKPLDTLARNSLFAISERTTFKEEVKDENKPGKKKKKVRPAILWMADVLFDEQAARSRKIFRIVNDDVLSALGLKANKDFRYSLAEIDNERLSAVFDWAGRVRGTKPKDRSLADQKALEFASKTQIYVNLKKLNRFPEGVGDLTPRELVRWLELTQGTLDEMERQALADPRFDPMRFIPRLIPRSTTAEDWPSISEASLAAIRNTANDEGQAGLSAMAQGQITPQQFVDQAFAASTDGAWLTSLRIMQDAYKSGDATTFNAEVAKYQTRVDETVPGVGGRAVVESIMNHMQPFYVCAALTVFALLLCAGSWFGWRKPLLDAAFAVAVVSAGLYTLGLVGRMYLDQRPLVFVTNLYSSAVFVGWTVMLVGLFLERIYRNSIGLTVACVVSFLSLIVAHFLDVAGEGDDNLEVLQAVLDTNFWLATHVTTVTFGYSATFLAGFLGITYLVLGICTPVLDNEMSKTLGRMIYGVVCGAMLLSFIGTVTGGIWGDQSWGRFWGWDTKENGALMIVMWNALILHARWGGMVRPRGIAILAVCGNALTTWSWFGVNQLGVGLHAYGGSAPTEQLWTWIFIGSQLLIAVVAAIIPFKSWLSYEAMTQARPAPKAMDKFKGKMPAST